MNSYCKWNAPASSFFAIISFLWQLLKIEIHRRIFSLAEYFIDRQKNERDDEKTIWRIRCILHWIKWIISHFKETGWLNTEIKSHIYLIAFVRKYIVIFYANCFQFLDKVDKGLNRFIWNRIICCTSLKE